MLSDLFTLMPFPSIGKSNQNTLPVLSIKVSTGNVTLELPDHAYKNRPYVGGFYIHLREPIPAGTTGTLPVFVGTNGDIRPLMAYGDIPVTAGNISGAGIYEIHYNKYTNELYLVNGGYKSATA